VKPKDLDLKKLHAFKLIAERGTLKSAAAALELTVPAVSFQLKRLEEELGFPLFIRHSNRVSLTTYGERLARDTVLIFDVVSEALSRVAGAAQRRSISISTSSDIAWYFAPLIASAMKSRPDLDISHHVLTSTEALARIRRGELDLCLGFYPDGPKGSARIGVLRSGFAAATTPKSAFRGKLSLKSLAAQTLILLPRQSASRKVIDNVFAQAGLSPTRIVEAGTCEMACRIAAQNGGVALVHSNCAWHHAGDKLHVVGVGKLMPEIEYSAFITDEPIKQHLIREITRSYFETKSPPLTI